MVRHEDRQMEVLMMICSGEQELPVFSGDGEAEMFVWLGGAFEDGWWVRETSVGELVSMIYGPCARVRSVALDPSPVMAVEAVCLVRVSRESFVNWIADSPCSFSPKASARHHAWEPMRPL